MSISKKLFGRYEGKDVYSYTLKNSRGAYVDILTYGGIMNRLFVPDKNGKLGDIVCGFDTIGDYVADRASYTGSIIGRYGNRIAKGKFSINGKQYNLALNEGGKCHLHGGKLGFNRKVWAAEAVEGEGSDSLVLTTVSPDGEEGYPGKLDVKVTYTFDDNCGLTIRYEADTDKDTFINMTSHTYYNLSGYNGMSVMKHELFIDADYYDETDALLLPVGEPHSVYETDFDFRNPRPIAHPFDHNFVLNGTAGKLRLAALVYERETGRTLTLYTDAPAVQFYTACGMNGKTKFKGGVAQRLLHAFCLETQYSPDTPNRPYMPQCLVKAGEKYDTTTKFVFGVKA